MKSRPGNFQEDMIYIHLHSGLCTRYSWDRSLDIVKTSCPSIFRLYTICKHLFLDLNRFYRGMRMCSMLFRSDKCLLYMIYRNLGQLQYM